MQKNDTAKRRRKHPKKRVDPKIAGSARVARQELRAKLGRVATMLLERLWLVRDGATGVTTVTNEHVFALEGHETIPRRTGQRGLDRLRAAGLVYYRSNVGRYDGKDGAGGLGFQWLDPKTKLIRVFKRKVFGAAVVAGTLGAPARVAVPEPTALWLSTAMVFSRGGARPGTGVPGNENWKGDGLESAYRSGRKRRPFVPKGDGQAAPKHGQTAPTPTRSNGATILPLLLSEREPSGGEAKASPGAPSARELDSFFSSEVVWVESERGLVPRLAPTAQRENEGAPAVVRNVPVLTSSKSTPTEGQPEPADTASMTGLRVASPARRFARSRASAETFLRGMLSVPFATIPKPPELDDEADDDALVAALLTAYRVTFEAHVGERSFAQVGKHRETLVTAGRLLRDEGVRPAEWVAWRFEQWGEMNKTAAPPGLGFVFGHIGERLTRKFKRDGESEEQVIETITDLRRFEIEADELGRTSVFGPRAKAIVAKRQRLMFFALTHDDNTTAAFKEKLFPGGWERHRAAAEEEAAAIQDELAHRCARGDWLWSDNNRALLRSVFLAVGADEREYLVDVTNEPGATKTRSA